MQLALDNAVKKRTGLQHTIDCNNDKIQALVESNIELKNEYEKLSQTKQDLEKELKDSKLMVEEMEKENDDLQKKVNQKDIENQEERKFLNDEIEKLKSEYSASVDKMEKESKANTENENLIQKNHDLEKELENWKVMVESVKNSEIESQKEIKMLKDEFETRKADYLAIIENLEKDFGNMQKDDTQNEKTLKEKNQKLENECLELRQSKIEVEGIQSALAVKICNKTGRSQDIRELLKVYFLKSSK